MNQPLFDFDLKRVSRTHYITGKAAINFPHAGSTTGGWHFLSYFDRESGVAKVSLAGIHYPDTAGFFGSFRVMDAIEPLAQLNGYHLKASGAGRIATQSPSRNQCVRRDLLLSLFLGKRRAMDPFPLFIRKRLYRA